MFERFGLRVLPFWDPDGLQLALVFNATKDKPESARKGNIPHEYAIRGFWGTKLCLTETESTAAILEDILGFKKSA